MVCCGHPAMASEAQAGEGIPAAKPPPPVTNALRVETRSNLSELVLNAAIGAARNVGSPVATKAAHGRPGPECMQATMVSVIMTCAAW